jgi:general secretion pathway protein K
MARDRRGFALIAAIWLMVALSALGLEVALLARTRRVAAANAAEGERARAAAEAGLEHARARLTRRLAGANDPSTADATASRDPWRAFDRVLPDTVALDDERYFVRIDDAGARVNLNVATEAQLRRLFAALRIDAGKADQLAQAIADWRDADDLARARGAEREAYLKAGLPTLPRNAPLVRVEELRDLYGMTPAIFSAVSPHVTVRGSGQVNVNTAGRAVLLSLPGVGEEIAATALRLRAGGVAISSLEQLATALSPGARNQLLDAAAELLPQVTFETRELEVTSEGWVAGSPVRSRVSGLFVRGGGAIFLSGKRSE